MEKLYKETGTMWYTHILIAQAGEPSALVYLSCYEGCTLGECFRDIGYHSLVIYDNMNNHAKCYRQISLIVKNPPGREAYPGDMFYQQARLLERAAQLSRKYGFGSLSAFPIYETQLGNIRTFIATNLISITDGQIYLSSKIFRVGLKPAIDIFKSVSRVGSRAQSTLLT
jgi:F-type H+-transporting ATPase subunit alpha